MPVQARTTAGFERLLGGDTYRRFERTFGEARDRFRGRSVWNVNSTGSGGGVAEMLGSLLGYAAGAGLDARWLVVDGDEGFFDVTKRIHNRLHRIRGTAATWVTPIAGPTRGPSPARRRSWPASCRRATW